MWRLALFSSIVALSVGGAASLTLVPDLVSPQIVNTRITFQATGAAKYRFNVEKVGDGSYVARDFDVFDFFDWTPIDAGLYNIIVTAHGSLETLSIPYQIDPIAFGNGAVVIATPNPLVALYSAGESTCNQGEHLRVQFRLSGSGNDWIDTHPKRCDGIHSVSILVAGMLENSVYEMRHAVGNSVSSSLNFLTAEAAALGFVTPTAQRAGPGCSDDGLILNAALFAPPPLFTSIVAACPYATDTSGSLLWYYPTACEPQNAGSLMNTVPAPWGNTFVMHMVRPAGMGDNRGQLLRVIDYAGNTVKQTNVDRINEMLEDMGMDGNVYHFHHDTRVNPNTGHLIVMVGVERLLEVEGLPGLTNVVGDGILDLDENLQLTWAWDSTIGYAKLPVDRRAKRDEFCAPGPMGICGPLRLGFGQAVDWTHGNTVTYLPHDKNLLISFRHQDWLIKVAYHDGNGSGDVMWRLGNEGDFDLLTPGGVPGDPTDWFSGQHQPLVYRVDDNVYEVVVYDNGNALNEPPPIIPPRNSRGQVYLIDETKMEATQILNGDLYTGFFQFLFPFSYAAFLGSSQKLANGNYFFGSGVVFDPNLPPLPGFPFGGHTESTEVDANGNIVCSTRTEAVVTYRTFRMKSLYKMDEAEHPVCLVGGFGDPHFKLWSGEYFDFHGECDLLLIKAPRFHDGLGLEVQLRTKIRYGYSFIETAAVKIGTDVLEVSSWGEYLLNGVTTANIPETLSNGYYKIRIDRPNKKRTVFHIVAVQQGGDILRIETFKDMVSVNLLVEDSEDEDFGDSVGILGSYGRGVSLARDGVTVLNSTDVFAQEWQVRPEVDESLFDVARQPQFPMQCKMPAPTKQQSRRLIGGILEKDAQDACSKFANDADGRARCVFDVLATQDLEVAGAGTF